MNDLKNELRYLKNVMGVIIRKKAIKRREKILDALGEVLTRLQNIYGEYQEEGVIDKQFENDLMALLNAIAQYKKIMNDLAELGETYYTFTNVNDFYRAEIDFKLI
ncbi:TPA: hypothetical protein ACG0BA_004758 [Serratia odorifera]